MLFVRAAAWLGLTVLLTACGAATHKPAMQSVTITMAPVVKKVARARPFIAKRDHVIPTRAPQEHEQRAIDEVVSLSTAECFVDWMRNAPFQDGHAEFDLVYDRDGKPAVIHLASSDVPAETTDCLRKGLASSSLEATDARVSVRMPIELSPPPLAPPEPVVPHGKH